MAKGKAHDKFNLLIGTIILFGLFFLKLHWQLIVSFSLGFLLSTFIFSPDTDIMPKKRAGPLRYLLFPYSIFFKHRGLSHSFIFGTVTRVFYGFFVFFAFIFIFHKMGYLESDTKKMSTLIYEFFLAFNLNQHPYKMLTLCFLGLFIADCCHLLLDYLTSLFKKIF